MESKIQELRKNLRGVVIAMITPMHEDYSLNLEGLSDNVQRAMDAGIVNGRGGFIIGGGGGEMAHLTIQERVAIVETAVKAADGKAPILGGVQDSGTILSIDIARRMQDVGADGIQLGQPYFYDRHTEDDFYRYFAEMDEAVDLGIAIYNTHWRAADISSHLLEKLADLPHVFACKWCSPGLADYRRGFLVCRDKINMIDNGGDIIGVHPFGACGLISGTGDFWPEYDLETWDALERGEYATAAKRLERLNLPYYAFRLKISGRTGGEAPVKKPASALCGRAAGPVRSPCRNLTAEELEELKAIFRAAGVPMV